LEQSGLLGQEFLDEAQKLFDKYYAIEINPQLSRGEKVVAMHQWRSKKYALTVQAGLTKPMVAEAMKSDMIVFRS
jgi:inorganic pyrophosphatase